MSTNQNYQSSGRVDVYEIVTKTVTEALEQGIVPWHQPWKKMQRPYNFATKVSYSGMNVLLLNLATMKHGYNSNAYAGWKQLHKMGGRVKADEHGHVIVIYKLIALKDQVEEDPETGELRPVMIPFLRYVKVWNLDQIVLPEHKLPKDEPLCEFSPIEEAQKIIAGYKAGPRVEHNGFRACYRPTTDEVHLPKPENFESPEMYYTSNFHELVHSTGHGSRLARKEVIDGSAFGSHDYSIEELVAEMGAAFLCGLSKIDGVVKHNAAYIDGWLKALKEKNNKKWLTMAATRGQKAVDHILGNEL